MRMKPIKSGSVLILTALLVSVFPIVNAAQVIEKEYQSFAQTSGQYHNIARQVIRMRKLTKLSLQQREAKKQYRRLSQQDFLRYVNGLAFDLAARRSEKNAKLPSRYDIARTIALNDLARDTFVNLPPLFVPTPDIRLALWARIANKLYPTDLVEGFPVLPDSVYPSHVSGIGSEEAERLKEDLERLKEQLESTRGLLSDLNYQHEILISVRNIGRMLDEIFETQEFLKSRATDQFDTVDFVAYTVAGATSGAAAGAMAAGVGAGPGAVTGAVGGAVGYVTYESVGLLGRAIRRLKEASEDENENGIPDCVERGDCKYLDNSNSICYWCSWRQFFTQLNLGPEYEQDASFYLRLVHEFGYRDYNLILRQ